MTLMDRGAEWLADRLKTAGGRSVTYRPGNHPEVPITAVRHSGKFMVLDDAGVPTTDIRDEWIIKVEDLGNVKPEKNHRIIETVNGVRTEYEVLPVGDDGKEYRLDDTGQIWTVYTQRRPSVG